MGQEHKEYTWNLIAKKLTGEATPEELRELESLLRNNPELHYPMQTITDLWNSTSTHDKKEAEKAFTRHLDRIQELKIDFNTEIPNSMPAFRGFGRQSLRPRAFALVAIPVLILIIAGYVYKFSHSIATPSISQARPASAVNEIFTASGSRTHLTLPDGTLVWLNAGSRINYAKNFGAGGREVRLTGEAFFDVAPNASKPFVIHTARIDIRVLGTRFNIKSYPTDKTTEATLIRGSIEISINNKSRDKIILKPNEKLVVSNEDSISLAQVYRQKIVRGPTPLIGIAKPTYERSSGAIIETSWVDNKLIFQDERFADVAKQMERWYGVSIRFDSEDQQELRFTGTFEKETVQQALDALKLTAAFNYSIEGTQITIHE